MTGWPFYFKHLMKYPQPYNSSPGLNWAPYESSVIILTERQGIKYVASGVLINPTIVLTAAHVALGGNSHQISLGSSLQNGRHEIIDVDMSSVTIHEDYNPSISNFHADLAMMKLKRPAPVSFFPLLTQFPPDKKTAIELVGFGERSHENRRTLTTVYLKSMEADNLILKNSMSLLGDSGGPLYSWAQTSMRHRTLYLAGIHSTKIDDNTTAEVSIADHYDWIVKQMQRFKN
jgi:hypothetical protein